MFILALNNCVMFRNRFICFLYFKCFIVEGNEEDISTMHGLFREMRSNIGHDFTAFLITSVITARWLHHPTLPDQLYFIVYQIQIMKRSRR